MGESNFFLLALFCFGFWFLYFRFVKVSATEKESIHGFLTALIEDSENSLVPNTVKDSLRQNTSVLRSLKLHR